MGDGNGKLTDIRDHHQSQDTRARLFAALGPTLDLPATEPTPYDTLPAGVKLAQHPVMAHNVVWLAFCGFRDFEISRKTGIPTRTIKEFLDSHEFERYYARQRDVMLAKIDDTMRERLQEVVLEAIETKIWLLRNANREALRNQIASELIVLGREILSVGRGNVSDLLRAVHEQAVKEGKNGSRTTTQRVTLEGDPAVVAAAIRGGRPGAAGGRPDSPPDDPASGDSRGQGTPEAALPPGEPGRDPVGGPGGVQS